MEVTEFDATLGGAEHLPFSANCLKFAASRSVEIAAMTESILRPSKTKLIFQSLPVHMRRRVMSHNSKRLPRKLRQAHLEQLKKSGLPPKQKRPTRKYRRRPANLLDEYNRRQKRNAWLETHIWHAKRFHMTERWGHRLAYAPCDKAFRACYRASSAHCLLQDISYHTPIQITGPLELIKEIFTKVTNSSCGLGLCAKAYIEGSRQGLVHLYGINTFPYGYIGRVQFLWVSSHDTKILMLFVHPSQTKQVESLLITLTHGETETDDYETVKKRRKVEINADSVKIKVMTGSFNRFRLTGPNSHAILVQSLKCVTKSDVLHKHKWSSLHSPQYLKEKEEYWEKISVLNSSSQLPPNIVVGLVVKDPRLSRPSRRTKAKLETYSQINIESLIHVPSFLSNSPLWDTKIHDTIKKEKISNHQVIELVSKTQLVPGEVHDNSALQSIPVVLIQQPGSQCPQYKKIGYGSGWDIIIPSGYALPFWLTFIMFGARSGGLRETESMSFEMGKCYLSPDSNAGNDNEKRIESDLRERYFKLPPSKRVNYTKVAINSPFICPWNILLSDWTDQTIKDFYVLRDWRLLESIQDSIKSKQSLPHVDKGQSCLIPVYLKLASKGNLKTNAIICMPEPGDFADMKSVFEPLHEDPNEKTRKRKRSEHKKLVKKLKRKRMKLKKRNLLVKMPKSQRISQHEPSEYIKTMRELWLPSNIVMVRNFPSRQIMGFISQGGFSFTEAQSCGIGYIACNALNMLLCNNFNQVLVRNTSSRKYQLANITVINSK